VTLARRASLFAEPAGAAAYAGLLRWCAGRAAARRERVAVLVTGNGLKDVDAAAAILPPPLQVGTDLSAALELVAGHSR